MRRFLGDARRTAGRWSVLTALSAAAFASGVGSAGAVGDWVFGSSMVTPTEIAYFARYVEVGAPGQMVIRCLTSEGVTVDAGAVNLVRGGTPDASGVVEISVEWPAAAGAQPRVETVTATGEVRSRNDGAVIVTFGGEEAGKVGQLIVEGPSKLTVTIGAATAEVSMDGAAEVVGTVARVCPSWPD